MKKAASLVSMGLVTISFVAASFTGLAMAASSAKTAEELKNIHLDKFTPKPLGSSPTLDLAGFKNHVVLIDFWASWCGPCKEALPHYNKLHTQYKDQGLLILGINEDDSAANRDEFLKTTPVQFALYADPNREFLKKFSVEALPTLFLLNKKGEIVLSLRGLTAKNTQILDEKIKALIKE